MWAMDVETLFLTLASETTSAVEEEFKDSNTILSSS